MAEECVSEEDALHITLLFARSPPVRVSVPLLSKRIHGICQRWGTVNIGRVTAPSHAPANPAVTRADVPADVLGETSDDVSHEHVALRGILSQSQLLRLELMDMSLNGTWAQAKSGAAAEWAKTRMKKGHWRPFQVGAKFRLGGTLEVVVKEASVTPAARAFSAAAGGATGAAADGATSSSAARGGEGGGAAPTTLSGAAAGDGALLAGRASSAAGGGATSSSGDGTTVTVDAGRELVRRISTVPFVGKLPSFKELRAMGAVQLRASLGQLGCATEGNMAVLMARLRQHLSPQVRLPCLTGSIRSVYNGSGTMQYNGCCVNVVVSVDSWSIGMYVVLGVTACMHGGNDHTHSRRFRSSLLRSPVWSLRLLR